MNRLLVAISITLALILLVVNFPALAVDRTFQIEVENSLRGTAVELVAPCKLARPDPGRIRVTSNPGIV